MCGHLQVVAKHYAAYSLETSTIPSYANRATNTSIPEGAGFINRHAFDAIVSDQDLAETYLPAFRRTVEAGAGVRPHPIRDRLAWVFSISGTKFSTL